MECERDTDLDLWPPHIELTICLKEMLKMNKVIERIMHRLYANTLSFHMRPKHHFSFVSTGVLSPSLWRYRGKVIVTNQERDGAATLPDSCSGSFGSISQWL